MTDRTRRELLKELSGFAITGTALTLALGGTQVHAARGYDPREDIYYLNKALVREYEVILSYDFSIETGLFEKIAFEMFNTIITDHYRHRDMIGEAITRLGGTPVSSPSREDFRKSFDAELIRTGSDALRFNQRFEKESYVMLSEVATYLKEPSLTTTLSGFAAEEAMHQALLIIAKASVPFDPTLRIRD